MSKSTTTFAAATYGQIQASGPPSPALGFARWTVGRAECVTVSCSDGKVQVLRRRAAVNRDATTIAYLLPGNVWKETLCGKIVQSEVLRQGKATTAAGANDDPNGNDVYETTGKYVAIKMDNRSHVRQLHHGTQAPSENPWKEVAALEFLQGGSTPTSNNDNETHHVAALLDALVDETNLYEILPFYCGGSLYEYMHHYPQGLPENQARHYFDQVLRAIYYIHSRGVCHRDISTHNLMLDETQQDLYLIDFAMCLRIPHSYPDDDGTDDVTDISAGTMRRILHTTHHCGKLRFMAPEMYQQQDLTD